MTISVSFMGLQRKLLRLENTRIWLPDGNRVSDLLDYVKASFPELPFPEGALIVVVNDRIASMDKILESKDKVTFLPALGGG